MSGYHFKTLHLVFRINRIYLKARNNNGFAKMYEKLVKYHKIKIKENELLHIEPKNACRKETAP